MEKMYRLWLTAIAKVHRSALCRMLDLYGSAEAIFNLSEDEIRGFRFLSDDEKDRLCLKESALAKNYLEYIEADGTRFITTMDEDYPTMLFDIDDMPQALFCRGKFVDLNNNILVAMVGARKCTQYGYECARTIARGTAREGAVIVSGMAMGIDSAAHEGALEANRPTVAVLGCGVNVVYPSSNRNLMKRIMETGMVISEYPVNTEPTRFTFPERNRIISGISHGLVVVEAGERSGSLITARRALEQGKDLFAVPGNINNSSSSGTNNLIKEGAQLVTCAADITGRYSQRLEIIKERFDISAPKNEYLTADKDNNDIEAAIAGALTSEPLSIDELSDVTGIPAADISTALLMMELSGNVITYPGGKYSKAIK